MGERLFISGVAFVLGVMALVAAVSNRDMFYQLPKVRLIESQWGRTGARRFYAMVGVFLLLLGVLVATDARRMFLPGIGP